MIEIKFNVDDLYKAVPKRISVRNYKKEMLSKEDEGYLNEKIQYVNNLNMGVKAYLINQNNDDIFTGIVGSYGKIKNAPNYFMLVGDTANENIQGFIGYLGEYLVLECESRNIGTCWVAGTFKKSKLTNEVRINSNEKLYCVISVGYSENGESDIARRALNAKKRKSLEKIMINYEEYLKVPEFIKESIQYAKIAPSAINRQPWKFKVSDNTIELIVDKGIINIDKFEESKKLDLGIALFHIIVALKHYNKDYKISFEKDIFAKVIIANRS